MKTQSTISSRGPTSGLRTALLSIIFMGAFWAAPASDSVQARQFAWESTGGPEIADMQVLFRHSDGTLLASTLWSGVFYSTDDGQSWQRSEANELEFSLQAFASMPSGNIVAGAGESGIFRSTDNGRTFEKVGFGTLDVSALMVMDDGALLVGTTSTNNGQVLRSTDEGETGFSIRSFGDDATVRGFAGSDGIIVAALEGYDGGIAVSTNGGINWTVKSLAGVPQANSVVIDGTGTFYAAVNDWDTKTEGELYRSTDNGNTWDILDPTPNDEGWVQHVTRDGNRIIVSSDLEVLTATTDGGSSFTRLTEEFYPSPKYVVRTDGGDLMMTASPMGLFRSSDDGATWQPSVSGLAASTVSDVVRTEDGAILAAANGLLFRSETGSSDWSNPLPLNDVLRVAVSPSGSIYTGGNFSADIRRSSDGGDTWTTLSDPLLADILVSETVAAVAGGEIFVAGFNWQTGTRSTVRSTDDGETWEDASSGLPDVTPSAIREAPDGTLYLTARYPGSLYRSTDRGASWANVTVPENEYINDIVFHPDGTIFIAGDLGAHRSSDGGSTWTLASDGLPEDINPFFGDGPPYLADLVVTTRGDLYGVGADGGIYHSANKGAGWSPLADGPDAYVRNVAIIDNRLYAGTLGGGLLRTTGSVVSIERLSTELPSGVFVSRNYPNPFSSQTTVEFGLDASGPVSLRVYDTLGREVARLADGTLDAGVHRITFDGAVLPAGTYIYRLSTPSGAASRTMTLLK